MEKCIHFDSSNMNRLLLLISLFAFAHSPAPNERTTKGRDLIVFNGFEMRKKELIANGLIQRIEQAKETAKNTNFAPREIIGETRENLDDSALLRMPTYSSIQKTIQRQRGEFTLDKNGNRFLLFDSRITQPELAKFFIFSTDNGLSRLKKYKNWSGDGTFKVCPANFLQLYTVNVLIGHVSVPSAYILMENRNSNTYGRAFTVLRNHLDNSIPLSFLMDFEESAKNGFQTAFGQEMSIKHCLFHLCQAVHRKIQKDGLANIYGQNEVFRKAIRALPSLAFLLEEEMIPAFNVFNENLLK